MEFTYNNNPNVKFDLSDCSVTIGGVKLKTEDLWSIVWGGQVLDYADYLVEHYDYEETEAWNGGLRIFDNIQSDVDDAFASELNRLVNNNESGN